MEAVLYAGGWLVEPCWLDLDGRGERAWHRAVDRHGVVHWLTTAQLQDALRRDGLDVGDLSMKAPLFDADDGCE
jgi:hypothetical protein